MSKEKAIKMARFILETDDLSEQTCILMRQAFSSLSGNLFVYKYRQTEGTIGLVCLGR